LSAKDALDRYYSKLAKQQSKPKRKNRKPEKEVERFCLEWMRARKWDVQIYESKAVFSARSGRYTGQSMKAGTVDCQGITPDGIPVYIEFKAPGRLSTFSSPKNHRQKEYLVAKIQNGAFGAVVDSANRLDRIFGEYINRVRSSKDEAKQFLLSELP
jgi:hypothetical protein